MKALGHDPATARAADCVARVIASRRDRLVRRQRRAYAPSRAALAAALSEDYRAALRVGLAAGAECCAYGGPCRGASA